MWARRGTTRRTFVFTLGALAGVALNLPAARRVRSRARFQADPFSLGVASGEPAPDGVVIWTRLAPEPLRADGGMAPEPVEVRWEVAEDEAFGTIVRSGTIIATLEWAHSIHVEVDGLRPERWYWYRFRTGEADSPVGRTRTAPAPDALPQRFRFAFASCQNWQQGFYNAYRDLAGQDLDLMVHLGDYIYEARIPENGGVRGERLPAEVRLEPRTLEGYRLRYALYKRDPDLQAAHAACPWVVTWDDHEVQNDYAADHVRPPADPAEFRRRRAAAYRAYYEHQPLRTSAVPRGPDAQMYRRLGFGRLFDLAMLDTRQYRSLQHAACSADERAANGGYCAASLDPDRTILGPAQRQWLLDGFAAGDSIWRLVGNQVVFARRDLSADPASHRYTGADKWDGYAAEREVVLRAMADLAAQRPFRPIFITGDIHANFAFELKRDWDEADPAGTFGAEFVGTSISSAGVEPSGPGSDYFTRCGPTANNPHNPFYDTHHGYVACTLTPEQALAEYRVVPTVRDPAAPGRLLAAFAVEADRSGVQLASACPIRP